MLNFMKKPSRQEILEDSHGLVFWNERGIPIVKGVHRIKGVYNLVKILENGTRFPDIETAVLNRLMSTGLLSTSPEDNYSVYASNSVDPNFSFNPRLNGQLLYFVSKDLAEKFACQVGPNGSPIVGQRPENLKKCDLEDISTRKWRELRVGVAQSPSDYLIQRLRGLKVIDKKGYAVTRKKSPEECPSWKDAKNLGKVVQLGFVLKGAWKFTSLPYAESYADSFHYEVPGFPFKRRDVEIKED